MKSHVWKKQATNDQSKPIVVRSWTCRGCGASKVRTSRRGVDYPSSPAVTVSVVRSAEECR